MKSLQSFLIALSILSLLVVSCKKDELTTATNETVVEQTEKTSNNSEIPYQDIEQENGLLVFKTSEAFLQTVSYFDNASQEQIDAFENRLNFYSLQQDIDNAVENQTSKENPHSKALAATPFAIVLNPNKEYIIGETIYKILEDGATLEIFNLDFAALEIARTSPEKANELGKVTANATGRGNCHTNKYIDGYAYSSTGVYRIYWKNSISPIMLMFPSVTAYIYSFAQVQINIGGTWINDNHKTVITEFEGQFCSDHILSELTTTETDGTGNAGIFATSVDPLGVAIVNTIRSRFIVKDNHPVSPSVIIDYTTPVL